MKSRVRTWYETGLDERGLDHLDRALRESHQALTGDWIARDPDTNGLGSQRSDRLAVIKERHDAYALPVSDPSAGAWRQTLDRYERREQPIQAGYPARPWGNLRARAKRWLVALLVIWAVALGRIAFVDTGAGYALAAVLVLSVPIAIRIVFLVLQIGRTNERVIRREAMEREPAHATRGSLSG